MLQSCSSIIQTASAPQLVAHPMLILQQQQQQQQQDWQGRHRYSSGQLELCMQRSAKDKKKSCYLTFSMIRRCCLAFSSRPTPAASLLCSRSS